MPDKSAIESPPDLRIECLLPPAGNVQVLGVRDLYLRYGSALLICLFGRQMPFAIINLLSVEYPGARC